MGNIGEKGVGMEEKDMNQETDVLILEDNGSCSQTWPTR